MFKLPDGSLRLIVQGLARIRLGRLLATRPYLRAEITPVVETLREADALEIDALERNIRANFAQVVQLSPVLSEDLNALASNITDVTRLTDFIASSLSTIGTAAKQDLLEQPDLRARMDQLNRILTKELEVLELGSKIQSQVQSEVGKGQREYFLREQMKAIQKELGEGDDQAREIDELREKIEAAGMPDDVKKEALRELDRLSKMPAAAAEYTVARTYIDWLVALPWNKRTDEVIDLAARQGGARRRPLGPRPAEGPHPRVPRGSQAEAGHEGPDPVLRRASGRGEDLAGEVDRARPRPQVRPRLARRHARRGGDSRAPPHVHRRAARPGHPGPPPGGIAQPRVHPRRGRQARHATSAAIPRRRCSRCSIRSRTTRSAITISTCRSTCPRCCSSRPPTCSTRFLGRSATAWKCSSSPATPRKRSSRIAQDHLVARQVANHGLPAGEVTFTDAAISAIMRGYTREAGVRNLEREIGSICRKIARRRAEGQTGVGRRDRRNRSGLSRRATASRRGDEGSHARARRRDRTGVDAGGRRRALRRGLAHAGRAASSRSPVSSVT